jgi:hypothetical protein
VTEGSQHGGEGEGTDGQSFAGLACEETAEASRIIGRHVFDHQRERAGNRRLSPVSPKRCTRSSRAYREWKKLMSRSTSTERARDGEHRAPMDSSSTGKHHRVPLELSVLCLLASIAISWPTYVPEARARVLAYAFPPWLAGVVLAIAFGRSVRLWLKCLLLALAIAGAIPLWLRMVYQIVP